MSRRRSRRGPEYHQAHLPVELQKTLDLRERAAQAHVIQGMIGQFLSELLANGIPLTLAVSVKQGFSPDPDKERTLITIYWQEAELDVHCYNDRTFVKRCLKCANYALEGHECPKFDLAPSPEESPEVDPSNEAPPSSKPLDGETEPASMD